MEVMAAHNTTHESLNPPSSHDPDNSLVSTTNGLDAIKIEEPDNKPAIRPEITTNNAESNTSIGVQTALSYTRQGTMVPLTSLLQLVNNSILTVMENIEKVLAVNPGDQNVIDNIDTFWNAAIASNSVSSSPQEDRMSPKQEKRSGTPSGNNEENIDVTGKPIVIQDRFQNSLEIPNLSGNDNMKIDVETQPPPLKRQCVDSSIDNMPSNNTQDVQAPSTPTSTTDQPQTSLSPTVNVAGSLTKYICPYCYKVFNWKTNMNRHISMTHLMKPKPAIKVPIMRKSKPYTCPLCGNTFAWRSNMNRHILHLHKIDHKQLNKYLLSAYLPDVQRDGENNGSSPQVNTAADVVNTFSSLSSLTMLPQQKGAYKTNNVNSPPTTTATSTSANDSYASFLYRKNIIDGTKKEQNGNMTTPSSQSSPYVNFLYRNHKALLDTVKKEQVPLHVKEAALTSFYQNNKSLFDSPPVSNHQSSPKPTLTSTATSPNTQAAISSLSALYQKALLEEQQRVASANAVTTTTAANVTSGSDVNSILYNQNHRAMLDTVSLLSNLGGVNLSSLTNGLVATTTDNDITIDSSDK